MSWLLSVRRIHEPPGGREALDEFDHQGCSEERLMNGTDRWKVKGNIIFNLSLKYTTIQKFGVVKIMFKIPFRSLKSVRFFF